MYNSEELISILENTLKSCADKIRSEILKSMAETPLNYDRPSYKHNKRTPHYPSLPGNPPAPDSGDLRKSIHWEVERNGDFIVAKVGSIMKDEMYPIYLEFGTSKMPAGRPWLRPAMKNNAKFIRDSVTEAVKNYVEKNG